MFGTPRRSPIPPGKARTTSRLLVVARENCIVVASELHGWMRGCMPGFMVARFIEVVPALPYTATNKVEKARLIAAGLGAGAWDAEAHP